MSSVKTENWITIENVEIGSWSDPKILPAGSYVKPIEKRYVPKWCLESPQASFFVEELDIFCHTQFGIFSIPRKSIVVR